MKSFIKKFVEIVTADSRARYRDRRAHYASSNLKCMRDQYWEWKKEPITNPSDFVGSMKMLVGSAVEDGITKNVLSKLSFLGHHVLGTQVPVGGSNPDWDGYLDALMAKPTEDGNWEKYVVEIKTKSGYGANFFYDDPVPTDDYLVQLGLYLKDLSEKGVTNKGCLFYVLLSDKHFGTVVQINCVFEDNTLFVQDANYSDGKTKALNISYDMKKPLTRMLALNEYLRTNNTPDGEYDYKYDLTPEVLRDTKELSDARLKKIIAGQIVYGSWRPLYSRYKNKQLKLDGITPERTAEEKSLARAEYKRRHPRSKI